MPRGIHSSKRGRSPSPRERKQVKLMPATIAIAQAIGDGGISDGIERLFAQLPVFYKVKLLLEQAASGEAIAPEHAEALLLELEELEIDQVYEEAIAEGMIACPGADGKPSAWIA